MGAYLSSPKKGKEIEDGAGSGLRFGASSMQGWRTSQEDAHLALPVFDPEKPSSLFGVYDGHGGREVSAIVAKHFPEVLRHNEKFQLGDFESALRSAYLEIDTKLLAPELQQEMKDLLTKDEDKAQSDAGLDDDEDDENEEGENGDSDGMSRRSRRKKQLGSLIMQLLGGQGKPK
jgi:protein phosphatase 1G